MSQDPSGSMSVGGWVMYGIDGKASILVPLCLLTYTQIHTYHCKNVERSKVCSRTYLETVFAFISISWPDNPIGTSHMQGQAIYLVLSHSDKCTHAYTRTAQVNIMKEGVWTAASPIRTRGDACHSTYVPHIPKIKPCRSTMPRQMKKDRRSCDGKYRKIKYLQ